MKRNMGTQRLLYLALILSLAMAFGCSRQPSDKQIEEDIHSKVEADPATKGSNITVSSQEGRVTLKGNVRSKAADTELQQIARQEPGVTDIDDQTSILQTPPVHDASSYMPATSAVKREPPPPPPPPPPVAVPASTVLTVRLSQALGSKISQTGTVFTGSVANPITINAKMVIPEGSEAAGVVREAKKAGRFKGGAVLTLELTGLTVYGHKYNLHTEAISQTSTGKGKRSAGMIAGGTGAGAAIGGIAGGGKGAAIGALAGVAAGTLGAATGNRDITLPAEAAVGFSLLQPLTLKPE